MTAINEVLVVDREEINQARRGVFTFTLTESWLVKHDVAIRWRPKLTWTDSCTILPSVSWSPRVPAAPRPMHGHASVVSTTSGVRPVSSKVQWRRLWAYP